MRARRGGGACVGQPMVESLQAGPAGSPLEAAWGAIRAGLRRDCGARTFDNWLKPIRLAGYDEVAGAVTLALPSDFMASWVEQHYAERLALAWRTTLPAVRAVAIRGAAGDGPALFAVEEVAPVAESLAPEPAATGSTPLEPRFSFESFVVGKANEVAYNAARTVAEAGRPGFNPLFLHGGTGLGKTHLMHAIGQDIREGAPRRARALHVGREASCTSSSPRCAPRTR